MPWCYVIVQSSLHENVIFSVCARMGNAAYIILIMWNSISVLDAWVYFRFNVSCGVAVGCHGKNLSKRISGIFLNLHFDVISISEVVFTFSGPLHF